jgi:hypothetical protein
MFGRDENCSRDSLKGRYLGLNGRIILKKDIRMWAISWFRIWTSGGLL